MSLKNAKCQAHGRGVAMVKWNMIGCLHVWDKCEAFLLRFLFLQDDLSVIQHFLHLFSPNGSCHKENNMTRTLMCKLRLHYQRPSNYTIKKINK